MENKELEEQEMTSGENPTEETKVVAPEETKIDYQALLDAERSKYLYLLSDFETYKRHASRDKIELIQTAGRDIVTAMLPVLDDFDRASKNGDLPDGIHLIQHRFQQILENKGLKKMEINKGDNFDPNTMDAVAEIPAPSEELKGKVVDHLEHGYQMGDKIIRFAKVVVGQ